MEFRHVLLMAAIAANVLMLVPFFSQLHSDAGITEENLLIGLPPWATVPASVALGAFFILGTAWTMESLARQNHELAKQLKVQGATWLLCIAFYLTAMAITGAMMPLRPGSMLFAMSLPGFCFLAGDALSLLAALVLTAIVTKHVSGTRVPGGQAEIR
jgi:hypothetical protein